MEDTFSPQESKKTATSNVVTWQHPGILNTQASLDKIREQVNGSGSTTEITFRNNAFDMVTGFINQYGNDDTVNFPVDSIKVIWVKGSGQTATEAMMKREAILAYAYALRWVKTGSSTDATASKKILNDYSTYFQKMVSISGTKSTQKYLEASWVAPTFAAAAEIIRSYNRSGTTAGWSANDVTKFNNFLLNLHNNYVDSTRLRLTTNYNNWSMTCGYAKMAIGTFLENHTIYNAGRNLIINKLPTTIPTSGQVIDVCQADDCWHGQYSLTAITYAAEIARNQGEGAIIFGSNTSRLLTGYRWTKKLFATCTQYREVWPGVEVAYNYYEHTAIDSLRARNNTTWLRVPKDLTFLGFTSFTHKFVKL